MMTDQMNRQVKIPSEVRRIISLVPSQTELLAWLGLNEEVVGITKFCVHPGKWFQEKQRVGGTKKVKPEIIRQLKPDLIIGNKEENEQSDIELLEREFPVWMSNVVTLEDALEMIRQIGAITGKKDRAEKLAGEITERLSRLPKVAPLRTAYFIWQKPWMVAGSNTFINAMMELWGLQNVFAGGDRYPEISLEDLKKTAPELILLSSEPYPFKARHVAEMKTQFPDSKVVIVDGEMFSWYGNRLLKVPAYLEQLSNELVIKSVE